MTVMLIPQPISVRWSHVFQSIWLEISSVSLNTLLSSIEGWDISWKACCLPLITVFNTTAVAHDDPLSTSKIANDLDKKFFCMVPTTVNTMYADPLNGILPFFPQPTNLHHRGEETIALKPCSQNETKKQQQTIKTKKYLLTQAIAMHRKCGEFN